MERKKAASEKKEIIELTDKKSKHYSNAYKSISVLGTLNDLKRGMLSESCCRERLDKAVFRFADRFRKGDETSERIFATAFTCDGFKSANAFGCVGTLYRVGGLLSGIFMNAFSHTACEMGIGCTISLSPIDVSRVNAVYIKESKALITDCELPICESFETEKVINTSRFADKNILSGVKAKLRAVDRLASEIESEAKKELCYAKATHAEIEKIYIPSMDFGALDDFSEMWISHVIRAE